MSHKILMLGGRRAGKSSILASILYALGEQDKTADLCTITDQTDYGGMAVPLTTKRKEIDNYLRTRSRVGANSNFLVDMTPSKTESTYTLLTQIGGRCEVAFDFVDVPGEWMCATSTNHNRLKELVTESDIFIIAIDTPYLMQEENPNINSVYNRIDEITNMMANITILNEQLDRKMIIFCPVKCERWTQKGQADIVTEKVCQAYRNLINNWVKHSAVDIWVMPIETVGGITHSKMLDGYRVYRNERDKIGELGSVNELTGQIMMGDGMMISEDAVYMVEPKPDPTLFIDFTQIPLSWYKTTDGVFKPHFCEQPAYHILTFLVEKEKAVDAFEKKKIDDLPWWRIFTKIFARSFGKNLKAYTELISNFNNRNIIKYSGDGFRRVMDIIEKN